MFISGKKLIPVPLGWIYQRIRVLHRSFRGSKDRVHNVVLLTKKEIYIRGMELEATELWVINNNLEVRLGGKTVELGNLAPIHYWVFWQGKQTV